MTQPRPRGTGRNLLDAYRLIPRLRPDWQFLLYHQHPLAACGAAEDLATTRTCTTRQHRHAGRSL
jgi:hypothetical protein